MSAVERVEDPGLPSALTREVAAVKGVSTTAAGPSPDAPETEPKKSRGVKLRPLLALAPYVARYRGQAFAALVALIIASAATLVVPLAVRRMI
ncbi:MAG: ABC transporter, partial [Afipia sp.]